ncbi:MAG: hypothetical protein ACRC8A_03105 [Microcoleaceae cyanobacterium]
MAIELKEFQTRDKVAEQSVTWLNIIAAGLIGGSFLLWSVPPFFLSRQNPVHRWVQGLSLLGAMAGSATVLAIGYRLRRIEPILQAERQQEEEDFLHWLAASRYYSESIREAAVESALSEQTGLPQILSKTPSGKVIDTTAKESLGAGREPIVDWLRSAQAATEAVAAESQSKPKSRSKSKKTQDPANPQPRGGETQERKRSIPKTHKHPLNPEPFGHPADESVTQPVDQFQAWEPDSVIESVTDSATDSGVETSEVPLGMRLPDPPPPQPPVMPHESDVRVQELWDQLNAPGCEWLMQLLLTKPLLIWGEQCSGKTSFASFLGLLRAIFFGHTVSVSDPHAHQNSWPELFEIYGADYNYNAINSRLVAYYQRLKASNLPHTSIWDEVTQYQESCEPALAGRFLKSILSDVRKPPEFPILLSHGNTLSTLGGGKGGIKKMQTRGLVEINLRAKRDRLGNLRPALRGAITGLDIDERGEPTKQPIALESWMQPKHLLELFPELLGGGFGDA